MTVRFLKGKSGTPDSLEGTVARYLLLEGTRSEHEAPVVVLDDGTAVRVHVVGDNPMEQGTLVNLLGKRVSVSGTWRNGVLRVEAPSLTVLPLCKGVGKEEP